MAVSHNKLAVLLLCTFPIALVQSQPLKQCGSSYYNPSQYTCYTGNLLCPILSSQKTFACGTACYLPSAYSCVNNQLGPAVTSGAFTVTCSAPGNFVVDQRPLIAAGLNFIASPTVPFPSTYCPSDLGASCPPGNVTVFYSGGNALAVEVPGGQLVYIAPNGLLSYTEAHTASYPNGSIFGFGGEQGGKFVFSGPGGSGWLACPSVNPPVDQIYANISTAPKDCSPVTLLLEPFKGGFGAWEYT